MILPDGYSDVPAGKIAAVTTHLEMTARPAPRADPAGAWTLRRVDTPALDWYRDLYGRVGGPWLWVSRIRLPDAELAAIIQSPPMERSGFRPFRRQVEVVNDPRLDGTVPRDVARHVPVIE